MNLGKLLNHLETQFFDMWSSDESTSQDCFED